MEPQEYLACLADTQKQALETLIAPEDLSQMDGLTISVYRLITSQRLRMIATILTESSSTLSRLSPEDTGLILGLSDEVLYLIKDDLPALAEKGRLKYITFLPDKAILELGVEPILSDDPEHFREFALSSRSLAQTLPSFSSWRRLFGLPSSYLRDIELKMLAEEAFFDLVEQHLSPTSATQSDDLPTLYAQYLRIRDGILAGCLCSINPDRRAYFLREECVSLLSGKEENKVLAIVSLPPQCIERFGLATLLEKRTEALLFLQRVPAQILTLECPDVLLDFDRDTRKILMTVIKIWDFNTLRVLGLARLEALAKRTAGDEEYLTYIALLPEEQLASLSPDQYPDKNELKTNLLNEATECDPTPHSFDIIANDLDDLYRLALNRSRKLLKRTFLPISLRELFKMFCQKKIPSGEHRSQIIYHIDELAPLFGRVNFDILSVDSMTKLRPIVDDVVSLLDESADFILTNDFVKTIFETHLVEQALELGWSLEYLERHPMSLTCLEDRAVYRQDYEGQSEAWHRAFATCHESYLAEGRNNYPAAYLFDIDADIVEKLVMDNHRALIENIGRRSLVEMTSDDIERIFNMESQIEGAKWYQYR